MLKTPLQAHMIVNAVWDELSGRRGLNIRDVVQDDEIEREIYDELLIAVQSAMEGKQFAPPSCLFNEDDEFMGYPYVE